jgi:hypothetical protein
MRDGARNHEAEIEAVARAVFTNETSISPRGRETMAKRVIAALDAVRRSPQDKDHEAGIEHPGPYRGRRNDFLALSTYWAKRAQYFEAEVDRLSRCPSPERCPICGVKMPCDVQDHDVDAHLDAGSSPQDEDHELREKIAVQLAENDQCGVGPLSRQEYLDDAEAIMSIIRTYGGTQEPRRSPQGEDHEAGIEAAWAAWLDARTFRGQRESLSEAIAVYLSRCPSPEHWSETALRDITRQRDEATTELRRLRQRPSPERNERVSQDHDPGRDD